MRKILSAVTLIAVSLVATGCAAGFAGGSGSSPGDSSSAVLIVNVLFGLIGLGIAYGVIFLAVRQALRSHAIWVATGKLDAAVGAPQPSRGVE